MSYQRFFESLSEHGRGILVAQEMDESIFEFVEPQDLQSLGMLLGDVLKAKKVLGVAKSPRELEVDDEEKLRPYFRPLGPALWLSMAQSLLPSNRRSTHCRCSSKHLNLNCLSFQRQ